MLTDEEFARLTCAERIELAIDSQCGDDFYVSVPLERGLADPLAPQSFSVVFKDQLFRITVEPQ